MRGLQLALLVISVGACSDALVGTWESDDEFSCFNGSRDRVSFTVDDDLAGRGEYCECEFDFIAEGRGDGVYRVDIDFDGPCFVDDGKYDCQLEREGARFDCDSLGDYDRVGD